MSIEKISVNGKIYDIADVDGVEAEKRRAQQAESDIREGITWLESVLGDGSFVVGIANLANAVKAGAITFDMLDGKLQLSVSVVDNLKTANTLMPLSANQGKILKELIDIINGTGEGSTDKKITDAIAALVDSAPENLDTLRELAEWIAEHGAEFAAVVKTLQAHSENLANLNTTILNYNRKMRNYAPVDKATVVASLGTAVERGMIVTYYTTDGWKSIRYISSQATAEAFADMKNWEDVDDFSAKDKETLDRAALSFEVLPESDRVNVAYENAETESTGVYPTFEIPAATTEKAGVMSVEDKKRIDKSSVFSYLKVADNNVKILRDFLCGIRIYATEIPDISLFSVVNGVNGEYKIQFTYVDAAEGTYYISYVSFSKEDYILTKTANNKVVELFVDWSVIPEGTSTSTGRTNAIISKTCFQPILEGLNKQVNDIAVLSLVTGDSIRVNRQVDYFNDKHINSNGTFSDSAAFSVVKCQVSKGDVFKLSIHHTGLTAAYSYAIYNSIDKQDESTLLKIGPHIAEYNNGDYVIAVPDGGIVLMYTLYGDSVNIYETVSTDNSLNKLASDIETLESQFETKEYIAPYRELSGKYVSGNGSLVEFSGYLSKAYEVKGGERLNLEIQGIGQDTGARMYAIYSDTDIWNDDTAVVVGDKLKMSSNGNTLIDVPQSGKVLITTIYRSESSSNASSTISEFVLNPQKYIDEKVQEATNEKIQEAITLVPNTCYVEVEGDILKYCTKYDEGNDLIIFFKPCMNNELVTFTNVGLAANTGKYPSNDFSRSIAILNSPGSDNIGPFSISKDSSIGSGVGGFCGANHCYGEVYGEEQVRTAMSDWYRFYLDDVSIEDGFKGYGKVVKVVTENTIFDPRIAPAEGDTVLNSPLIKEMMAYTVSGTQVEVCATHRFLKDAKASYYGQQSVFRGESQIITPLGAFPVWTAISDVTDFTKGDYPEYRAVSMKSDVGYENDVLLAVGLGTRNMVGDTANIFRYSSTKTYTLLLNGNSIKQDEVLYWAGVYSWGCIVDDDDNYIYKYQSGGKTFLTICSKRAYSNVLVTSPIDTINSKVKATGENITIESYIGEYLILNADGVGSITVEVE